MIWGSEFQSREPLFWVGGRPIYATVLLIFIYCVGMVFTALSRGVGGDGLWLQLTFSSEAFFQGKWWQALTYPLMNHPSLWFGIEMVMLYWFGSELEKYFGRKMFFIFYGILWVVPVWMLVIASTLVGDISYHGSGVLNFCVFAGFAMIYPSVELIFRIQARWIAAAIGALWILSMLSVRSWAELSFFLFSVGLTWSLLKWDWEASLEWLISAYRKKHRSVKKISSMHMKERKKHIGSVEKLTHQSSSMASSKKAKSSEKELESYIDQILDKIAAQGMASLNETEHELLKRHSEALAKEEKELTK